MVPCRRNTDPLCMRPPCFIVALLITLFALSCASGQDGLFVDIVTSSGNLRAELYPEEAPLAVSNFVGLVEGSQKAINPTTGQLIDSGFYDGTVFHRVIQNTVIQAGSPTGMGLDGPGYSFQDEFHPSRTFDGPFVLAMANSGPNSNGSQFLITVAPTPELNNVHTIFGGLVDGDEVATSISGVITDQADRPLAPITIESIAIDRVGEDALAFQPDFTGLPIASQITPRIVKRGDNFQLDIDYEERTDYQLFISRDLQQWTSERVAFVTETTPRSPFDLTIIIKADDRGFFRLTQVKYPVVIFPPTTLGGRTLDAAITSFGGFPQQTWINYAIRDDRFARVTLKNGTMGDVTNYSYTLNSPTRATVVLPSSLANTFSLVQFILNFASASTGTFSAILPKASPPGTQMSGTFTLNETPSEP